MSIFTQIPKCINKNLTQTQAIYLSVLFNLFCYLIMFFRALMGSAKRDWGYSEFLLNYSEGFIRRGLSGTVLLKIYEICGLDPYLVLTLLLSTTLILILVLYYYLLKSTKVKASTIIFLSANPLLLNAPFLSVTMFRKDWLIIVGLILHAFFVRLIVLGKITPTKYIVFLVFILAYSQVIIFTHEIVFLFVFIHYVLLRNILSYLTNSEAKLVQRVYLFFIFIQMLTFVFLVKNRGTPDQVLGIAKSISSRFELGNINAILAFGGTPSEIISQSGNLLNFSDNLFLYSVWFYIGPFLIFKVLRHDNLRTVFVSLIAALPILTLFFPIGGDWGRWLVLLSFTLFILLVSNMKIVEVSPNTKPEFVNSFKFLVRTKSFFVILLLLLVSLLFRVPVNNPSSIVDIWSGVAEILLQKITF